MSWPDGGSARRVKLAVRCAVRSLRRPSAGDRRERQLALATLARLPESPSEDALSPAEIVAGEVGAIIQDVTNRGDLALRELARRHDGVELDELEVPEEEWDRALDELDPAVRAALERAERNIASYHAATKPRGLTVEVEPGVRVSQHWDALESVGVYAPGGRAAYPSSVLMGAVPARVAGVGEVIVCSPPGRGGLPPEAVLAACSLAGVSRLFALGGAGAIAAMANGTQTVPTVLAIVGPGNAWVTEAKRQVRDRVRIDSLAGPSEVLVVADETADPHLIALELTSQAEHDPEASCVLVTTSGDLAYSVDKELPSVIEDSPRKEIIHAALAARGGILVADGIREAFGFASWYAPEHLVVIAQGAEELVLEGRPDAGSIFIGPHSSVCFGDYLTGANHVLPTGRQAEVESGLSTRDFMRSWTMQSLTAGAAARLADDVAVLAEAEGLPAHADAARARSGSGRPPRSRRLRIVR